MKGSDVHGLKDPELLQRLVEMGEESFNLRVQHATGELENTARLSAIRRDLARLLTVARERGLDTSEVALRQD